MHVSFIGIFSNPFPKSRFISKGLRSRSLVMFAATLSAHFVYKCLFSRPVFRCIIIFLTNLSHLRADDAVATPEVGLGVVHVHGTT